MKMITKNSNKVIWATGMVAVAAWTSVGAQTVVVQPAQPAPPPPVTVQTPAPRITVQTPAPVVTTPAPAPGVGVTIGVPDGYVWDGAEYVGMIGGQYYYLGPNQVWLPMSGGRLMYFHDWEKHHKDWVKQEIRNEKYRRDAEGHDYPWHDHGH